ncbi:hypothetical protein BDV95DRAFT_605550 [Massariosphaeria phaeospora]|uniref:F-box domain-containing protein n=1 Tax=Massariosphaeria phaeospora TaxID=100035 RepID=A0A7C8MMR0_9PLEO|nr:hypothetical protein BDV95DRAFT_605550 [Massariosphaeria phaeospora]
MLTILDLPNELLSSCFAYVSDSTPDVQNLRLVSRRFHDSSSPFLISEARVSFTTRSFSHLELLANNPIFSKSIKKVTIDVSYYDSSLAATRGMYALACVETLFLDLRRASNPHTAVGADRQVMNIAAQIMQHWHDIHEDQFDDRYASKTQKILLESFGVYQDLVRDQELILETQCMRRLVRILEKLVILKSIVVEDFENIPAGNRWTQDEVSEARLKRNCLMPSPWQGTNKSQTTPPTDILSGLFEELAKSIIRPTAFEIRLTPPSDLRCIHFTREQFRAMRETLVRTKILSLQFLDVGICYAGGEDYRFTADKRVLRDESSKLCDFVKGFFSSSTPLDELHLSLKGYANLSLGYRRTFSFCDIFDSDYTPRCLPPKMTMCSVPFLLPELCRFVEVHNYSLKWFGVDLILLRECWKDALDVLRGLENLEHLEFVLPRDHISNGSGKNPMEMYNLRETQRNPLMPR